MDTALQMGPHQGRVEGKGTLLDLLTAKCYLPRDCPVLLEKVEKLVELRDVRERKMFKELSLGKDR